MLKPFLWSVANTVDTFWEELFFRFEWTTSCLVFLSLGFSPLHSCLSACECVVFWPIFLSRPLQTCYVSHGNSLTDDPGLSLNSLSIKSCETQIMKHLITTVGEPKMKGGRREGRWMTVKQWRGRWGDQREMNYRAGNKGVEPGEERMGQKKMKGRMW